MGYSFRQAEIGDVMQVWGILEKAIQRRKADGSNQWQDGYPNLAVVQHDIDQGVGYVLTDGNSVVGYCAVMINDEPEYANLKGKWLTNEDFVVYHRVAIAESHLGKGLAQQMLLHIEEFALAHRIYSIKADTNFDNAGMLRIFKKLGYRHCGEVMLGGLQERHLRKC